MAAKSQGLKKKKRGKHDFKGTSAPGTRKIKGKMHLKKTKQPQKASLITNQGEKQTSFHLGGKGRAKEPSPANGVPREKTARQISAKNGTEKRIYKRKEKTPQKGRKGMKRNPPRALV